MEYIRLVSMGEQSIISKERIIWIDQLKFVGIYLVILAHSGINQMLHNYIYAFHMPLFFFISGFLFSFEKIKNFQSFLRKRSIQLLKPYLFFNIMTYLFWFFVGRKFGADSSLDISPFTPLIGIIYGNGTGYYFIHAPALWFLPCLFVVEILFYLAFKQVEHFLLSICIIFSFLVLGKILLIYKLMFLPWSINVALIAIFFYWLGYYSRRFGIFKNGSSIWEFFSILLLGLIFYFSVPVNGPVDMSSSSYGNIILFMINATIGLVVSLLITKACSKFSISLIDLLGQNTLIILAFHVILLSCIKGTAFYIFNIPLIYFESNIAMNCIVALLALILCLVPIYIINRFFPYMIGKNLYTSLKT